jgi:hypothetical protein
MEVRHRHRWCGLRSHEHGRSARGAGCVPLAPVAPVRRQADPFPPARSRQQLLLGERFLRRAQAIDRPPQRVGQDRPGLALAVSGGDFREVFLGWRVVLEQAPRRFRARPCAMGVAELHATGGMLCAVGLPRTFDQAAVGDERLDPGEARAILDLRAHHQGQDVADTGDRTPARQRHRIRAVGGLLAGALQVGDPRLVTVDQGQVHRHGRLHAAVIDALNEAAAVLGLGQAAQGLAEVILASRMRDVRVSRGPFVQEMMAAAPEIVRGAHPARVDVSLRHEASAPQRRDGGRIEAVVLGVAAVHRPQVEGRSQDEGKTLILAELSTPVPGEQAFDADHHSLAAGVQRLEKRLGSGADVVVHAHLAVGIEDAEVHPVDVQVEATVKRVWNRVESPRVSSLWRGMGTHLQQTRCASVCQKEEAFIIINTLERTNLWPVAQHGGVRPQKPSEMRRENEFCQKRSRILIA